jgi:trigger factor
MSEITVTKTKEDVASRSLQVSVPADLVQRAESKALRHYAQRARLPGFRQGKAPEAVLRRKFGEAIRQTALEELIRESWDLAIKSGDLKPIAEPHIHELKFEEGKPLEFEFHVEVRPDVKLARTGGFTIQRKVAQVTEHDIEERLRDLRERKATWLPVEGTKPAPGNLVRLEVSPIEGGQAGPSQPYTIVLGEGRTLPEIEEAVMGLLPGETGDSTVRFPDDHPDESKRGQTRQVRITLHEVKRQELPGLDDQFAREVVDFETLDALRAAVRSDLESDAKSGAEAGVRQELLQQIYGANEVPAPAILVEKLIRAYMASYQIPAEQFETFAKEFRGIAEQQVRRELVIDAVVEAQELAATEAEIDARVQELAAARNMQASQLYAQLEKAGRLRELERSLTEEKAFAWLLQQSTVVDA